jgi:hypothetical protein
MKVVLGYSWRHPKQIRYHSRIGVDETMKRQTSIATLFSLLAVSLSLAAPLGLSGSIKTNLPNTTNLRVGAFLADHSGNPAKEIVSSSGTNGSFTLSLPDAAPPSAALGAVVVDSLDWPGLVGKVSVSGSARAVRVVLRAYQDNDRSGGNNGGDRVLETAVTRGRGSLIVIYSDAKFRVQGDKGFDVTVEPGWNLISVDLGKSIETKRVPSLDGLQLEVFAG